MCCVGSTNLPVEMNDMRELSFLVSSPMLYVYMHIRSLRVCVCVCVYSCIYIYMYICICIVS